MTNKESISDIYTRIQEELRNQHSNGYAFHRSGHGCNFRDIVLMAKNRRITVQQSRGGYRAAPPPPESPHE